MGVWAPNLFTSPTAAAFGAATAHTQLPQGTAQAAVDRHGALTFTSSMMTAIQIMMGMGPQKYERNCDNVARPAVCAQAPR